MKKFICIVGLQICSLTLCTSYVVSPFVAAISQRMYYLARLEKPIRFLQSLSPSNREKLEEILKEWDILSSFRNLKEPLYGKKFIKKLFRVLHECTTAHESIHPNYTAPIDEGDISGLCEGISTDDIAFRYYLTQRLYQVYRNLEKVQNNISLAQCDMHTHFQSLVPFVTHHKLKILLLEIIKRKTIGPLLDEWEDFIQCKNLTDFRYMKEFLLLTLGCMNQFVQCASFHVEGQSHISRLVDARISHIIKTIDQSNEELYKILTTLHNRPYSLAHILYKSIIPVVLVSIWIWGQV